MIAPVRIVVVRLYFCFYFGLIACHFRIKDTCWTSLIRLWYENDASLIPVFYLNSTGFVGVFILNSSGLTFNVCF